MNLELYKKETKEEIWQDLRRFLAAWELENEPLIKSAFDLAESVHRQQKRDTGEPYFTHPTWVAKVVAQLGIGRRAIAAALLHDTVEDGQISIEKIATDFDDEIALLVEGLTDVKQKTRDLDVEMHQTNIEVFRKFLFSSVNDVRVLIIRIVDKLHNGLTMDGLEEGRKIKYAKKVLGIYSPVAEYVGLHYFKRMLDDIAFRILYPKEAEELEKQIEKNRQEEIKAENLVKAQIAEMLTINRLSGFEIQTRIKGLYSSYQKTKKYGTERGLKDRVGLRILVKTVPECYLVLGLIHSKYPYIEDEFNDYISSPKENGYRSIQTTFKWAKVSIEVQIRTFEMHEFNEFGPASHIAYKLSKGTNKSVGYEWIKELINWQNGDHNVNNYRISVLNKYIYVFTPKGDVIQLPKGSTALDFGYRIHSDVGDRCFGVKINQKMAKIDDELKTGDVVEILMGKKVNVSKNWLGFVKTNFAKERIKKMVQFPNE